MEHPSKRQKISRIQARRVSQAGQQYDQRDDHVAEVLHARATPITPPMLRKPLPGLEQGGFKANNEMPSPIQPRAIVTATDVTVVVSVIAEVDSSGHLIALETLAPVPAVPSVPSVPPFPSDLTVPAVPAFPSDLTVPAVPQATNLVVPSVPQVASLSVPVSLSIPSLSVPSLGLPSVNLPSYISSLTSALASAAGSIASELALPSSVPAAANSTSTTSAPTVVTPAAVAPGSNSSVSVQDINGTARPANASLTLSNTLTSLHSSILTSPHGSKSGTRPVLSTITITDGSGNFNGPANPAATDNSGTGASGQGNGSGISQRTSTVVGGVFGGLAGVALLLALALLLLRWYKQRRPQTQMQRLADDDAFDAPASRSLPPPMSQRRSFIPAAAAGFVSRFSAASKESELGSPTQERGFQKISGRKLPSAFSGGITEADIQNHRHTMSETSFYRDSRGFYGGSGEIAGPSRGVEKETLMPSPARTPVIHHPYSAVSSPPHTPLARPSHEQGTLGRSHPSHDGSRGSKFTENV